MSDAGFITISVTGANTVRRKLVTWGKQVSDLTPAWQQIGADLLNDFMDQILSEGGTYGRWSNWKPLSPYTVKDRLRKGYGGEHPIMWRTGLLLRSLSFQDAPGNVFIVRPASLVVGSEIFYAGYHQTGTPKMPARPLVGLSRKRQSGIVQRLNDYIQDQIRQAGLDS